MTSSQLVLGPTVDIEEFSPIRHRPFGRAPDLLFDRAIGRAI